MTVPRRPGVTEIPGGEHTSVTSRAGGFPDTSRALQPAQSLSRNLLTSQIPHRRKRLRLSSRNTDILTVRPFTNMVLTSLASLRMSRPEANSQQLQKLPRTADGRQTSFATPLEERVQVTVQPGETSFTLLALCTMLCNSRMVHSTDSGMIPTISAGLRL